MENVERARPKAAQVYRDAGFSAGTAGLLLGVGLNLIGVVCQRLAKRRDGKGRVPVVEIMMATPIVRKYILEGEFEKLKGAVGNREAGSQSFDQHLTELFQKQIIDVNEAKRLASNVDALNLALRGITNSDTRLR